MDEGRDASDVPSAAAPRRPVISEAEEFCFTPRILLHTQRQRSPARASTPTPSRKMKYTPVAFDSWGRETGALSQKLKRIATPYRKPPSMGIRRMTSFHIAAEPSGRTVPLDRRRPENRLLGKRCAHRFANMRCMFRPDPFRLTAGAERRPPAAETICRDPIDQTGP